MTELNMDPADAFPPRAAESAELIRESRAGNGAATERLTPLVYEELRRVAKRFLERERADHTLQPTALVNEAFVRLVGSEALGVADREHFLALGARAMRHVLVDHARRRGRERRGGGRWKRVSLSEPLLPGQGNQYSLVELSDTLERLAELDERAATVVELRFFGGLKIDEIASVLGVSSGTVDNDWYAARAWLSRALRGEGMT